MSDAFAEALGFHQSQFSDNELVLRRIQKMRRQRLRTCRKGELLSVPVVGHRDGFAQCPDLGDGSAEVSAGEADRSVNRT